MFFQFVRNNNNNSVDLDKITRGQLDECYLIFTRNNNTDATFSGKNQLP